MKFKEWPLWIRLGIIFGCVGVVYNLLLFLVSIYLAMSGSGSGFGIFYYLFFPVLGFIEFWCNNLDFCTSETCMCETLFPTVVWIIGFSILGMIIGWIVERMKR